METCVVTLFTYSTLSTDTVFDLIAGGREGEGGEGGREGEGGEGGN